MNPRVTAARLAALERQLTDRDRAVLGVLVAVRMANGQQLRRAVWSGDDESVRRAGRRQLARLVQWHVIERLERRSPGLGRGSEAYTYALSATGQRLADGGASRRPRLPGRPMWAHCLMGAETLVRLLEATRGSDRVVREWQGEPACWQDVRIGLGERVLVKPDALVRVGGDGFEDLAFIEIDMGSQSRAVLKAKMSAYIRLAFTGRLQQEHSVFPAVTFVTISTARKRVIEAVIATVEPAARELFRAAVIDDAAQVVMGGDA